MAATFSTPKTSQPPTKIGSGLVATILNASFATTATTLTLGSGILPPNIRHVSVMPVGGENPAANAIEVLNAIDASGLYNLGAVPGTLGLSRAGTVSGKVFTISFIGDGTNLNETSRTVAM